MRPNRNRCLGRTVELVTGFRSAIHLLAGLALRRTLVLLVCLIAGLAVVAAIPLVNLVGLGYLLFAWAYCQYWQISGWPLWVCVRAGRLGGAILGVWLVLWPARMLASYVIRRWSCRLRRPGFGLLHSG